MSRSSEIITVILSCNHRRDHRYHAQVGEWSYCSICNKTCRVIQTSEVIACCDDCTVKRKFGNGPSARSWLMVHIRKNPRHTGKIITADLSLTMVNSEEKSNHR